MFCKTNKLLEDNNVAAVKKNLRKICYTLYYQVLRHLFPLAPGMSLYHALQAIQKEKVYLPAMYKQQAAMVAFPHIPKRPNATLTDATCHNNARAKCGLHTR